MQQQYDMAAGAGRAWGSESRLRLLTSVRLRWFAVAGQLAAIAVVYLGWGFDFPVGYCLILVAMSAWINVFLRVRFGARHRLGVTFATALLAYDLLQLAALLYLTGGIENPFAVLLVAPVTVSAATLPSRNTVLLGAAGLGIAVLLTFHHLPLPWWLPGGLTLAPEYKLGLLASIACCMIFLAVYAWRLSKEARLMTQALAATELVLAREQRLHALDGLAAAAAHELGTPLSTIALVTKELEREVDPASPIGEDIALLRVQALRCREILQKLTRHPSEQDPMHARVTVSQILDEAAEPHRSYGPRIEISSGATPGEPASEPVAERQPGVIFGIGNLIENATDFASDLVEVRAEWSAREVVVTVRDDGPGFPVELMDTLGEPYVSARRGGPGERKGLGLGVFIAKSLLERSGASIDLANRAEPRSGAVVRIVWPRQAFEAGAAASLEAPD